MKKLINQRFIEAINFIISENPQTQKSEIAKNLEIGKSTLSEILKQRMNVGIDALALLSNKYSISLDWLINGAGTIKAEQSIPEIKQESKTPQVITIDKHNEDNIVMVPVKAQAGYLNGYADPKFIAKLPTYSLPNLRNGIFRMFQVSGFSMIPTLHHNSIVVGQFVENWSTDIKDNRIYVVVTKEHGVVVKRLLNRITKYGNIFCKSDNRKEFPSFATRTNDVTEIWEVKMALIHDLPDPTDIYDKINDLEAELLHVKDYLNITEKYSNAAESSTPYNKK